MLRIIQARCVLVVLAVAALAILTSCVSSTAPSDDSNQNDAINKADPCGTLPEDLNGDGIVDVADVGYLAFAMRADLTGDDKVDGEDRDRIASLKGLSYPEHTHGLTASELAQVCRLMAADLNGDCLVSASDIAAYAVRASMAERADVNRDGFLNDLDVQRIQAAFGRERSPCPRARVTA